MCLFVNGCIDQGTSDRKGNLNGLVFEVEVGNNSCGTVAYTLIDQGICNGTTGIITNLDLENQSVQVAFSIRGSLIDTTIYKQTHYFQLYGNNCHRTQFPLQNSFALTVHKTQSLTLLRVSLALDTSIFSSGQAYVAL